MIKKILILILVLFSLSSVFADNINNEEVFYLANDDNSDYQFLDTAQNDVSFDDTYNIVKDINFTEPTYLYSMQGELENPSSFTTAYLRQTFYYEDGTSSSQESSLVNSGSVVFQNFSFTNPNYLNLSVNRVTWEIKSDVSGIVRLRNKIYNEKSNLLLSANYYNSDTFNFDYRQHADNDEANLFSYTFSGDNLDTDSTSWINFKSDNTITRNDGTLNGFTFNDGTLTNFADTTRKGARVTGDINGASWSNGVLEFDGVDDRIDYNSNPLYNWQSDQPISGSVRFYPLENNNFDTIYQYTSSPSRLIVQNDAGQITVGIYDGSSYVAVDSSTDHNLNEWNYLNYTYDGTTLTTYLNGVEITGTNSPLSSSNNGFVIGTRTDLLGITHWNGSLSDIRLFNFELNSSQIEDNTNNETVTLGEHQVSHVYRLDEGEGVKAYDSGTTGKFGNYLSFDGNDDYVNLGTSLNSYIADGLNFTVGFWAKRFRTGNDQEFFFVSSPSSADSFTVGYKNGFIGGAHWVSGWADQTQTNNINANDWIYVTVVHDSTNEIDLYINGTLDNSGDANLLNSDVAGSRLGSRANNDFYFNGNLEEVRVWDYKLNSSQIQAEMNSENPVLTPVASYSFSEDKGTTAFDTNAWVQGNTTNEVFNKALSFDGSNYLNLGDVSFLDSESSASVCLDIKLNENSFTEDKIISEKWSNDWYTIFIDYDDGNRVETFWRSSGGTFGVTNGNQNALDDLEYHTICSTYEDGVGVKLYIDGVQSGTTTSATGTILGGTAGLTFAGTDSNTLRLNANYDNINIYSSVVTDNQESNTSNLVWASSFEQVDNLEVYDRNDQICYNCSSVSLTTNSPEDGIYTQYLTDSVTGFNNYALLYFDTENPTYVNNIPLELNNNNRTIDFTSFLAADYGLSGKSTCIITLNNSQSTTCDDTSFKFGTAGTFSYTIEIEDLAGNQNSTSGSITVDPNQLFRFEDVTTGNPLTEYTFNGINYTQEYAIIPLSDLTIGTNSFSFDSLGYVPQQIVFDINISSELNLTSIINKSTIVLKVYDLNTGNLITEPVDVTLIQSNFTGTTSNGELNISQIDFYNGQYQVILESTNYETETIFFTYTNQEVLNLNAYMLPTNTSNLGVLNVKAETSTNIISSQLVNLLTWDSDSNGFITVGQSQTDSNGDAFFNVELGNKLYKVTATRGDETITSAEQIVQISGTTIYMIFGDTLEQYEEYTDQDIIYSLTNTSHNATHELITFSFSDPNNLVTSACLEVNRLKGILITQLSENCLSSANGEIQIYTSINNTYTKEVLAKVYKSGTYTDLDNIIYQSSNSLEISLGSIAKWLSLALFIAVIGLGIYLGNVAILGVGTIVGSWFIYGMFSTTLTYTVPLLITIIMILVLYGTFKKRF